MGYCDATVATIDPKTMMPSSTIPTQKDTGEPPPVGSGPDALGGGDGLGLGGGVSCVGRFGGRG